jgi:hypothetical protein
MDKMEGETNSGKKEKKKHHAIQFILEWYYLYCVGYDVTVLTSRTLNPLNPLPCKRKRIADGIREMMKRF